MQVLATCRARVQLHQSQRCVLDNSTVAISACPLLIVNANVRFGTDCTMKTWIEAVYILTANYLHKRKAPCHHSVFDLHVYIQCPMASRPKGLQQYVLKYYIRTPAK